MTDDIVARELELSIVRAFSTRPAQSVTALVIEGEPGIGKSTIWREGVQAARSAGLRVLTSAPAESEASIPHLVLGDLLSEAGAAVLDDLPAPRRRALAVALRLAEPTEMVVDPLTLHVGVASALALLTREGTLLIAIDDEQWIDAASRAALVFALRRLGEAPIALLIGRRSNSADAVLGLDASLPDGRVERLTIGPLSLGATQVLLSRRLDQTLPRPLLIQVHETAGGNPFIALELARALASRPLTDGVGLPKLPPSLEPLLADRLAMIDPSLRHLLLLVASHGRLERELRTVMAVQDEEVEQAVDAGLLELVDDVARFTHPLLAAAVYGQATSRERRRAHRELAAHVADPVQHAGHLAMATESPDQAVARFLESAANLARARGLPIAAAGLAEHAGRLTPPGRTDDALRRGLIAVRAHLAAGNADQAREILARQLAAVPSGIQRAEMLILGSELEEPGPAVALLEQALHEASRAPAVQAAVHIRLADVGRFVNGRGWAEQHVRAALQTAERLGDDRLGIQGLSVLAVLRFEDADPDALNLAREAHQQALALNEPDVTRVATWVVGHQLMWLRRNDDARDWLERAIGDAGEHDELLRATCLWYLALVELWAGRWDIAWTYAEESAAIDMQYGIERPQDHMPQALIALHRGQFALARAHSTRAIALAEGMMLPTHTAILGVADLWSGQLQKALGRLEAAQELSARRGVREPVLFWIGQAEYVEALLQAGRRDDADRFVGDWEATVTAGSDWVVAELLRSKGLIAAADGNLDEARAFLQEGARRHALVGDLFGRGRDLLALGGLHRRQRQKRMARNALEEARNAFDELGAACFAAAARAELGRLGGRRRIEGLSASERRVAELVADGRTNREIAATLFLGERTVASHLTHIYAKLGIRSRTELARRLPPPDADGQRSEADGGNVPTF